MARTRVGRFAGEPDEFTVAAIRENAPGVSDGWISQVLGELKREGIVESLGTGRSARWKRLRRQT